MNIKAFIITSIIFLTIIPVLAANDIEHPDIKLSSNKIVGRLINYQHGDYAHVSVAAESGDVESYFIDDEICFMAQNREHIFTIYYDEVKRYFPEGNGYYPANIIQSISLESGNKLWHRTKNATPSLSDQQKCHETLNSIFIQRKNEQ